MSLRTEWDPTTGFGGKPVFTGESGRFLCEMPLVPQELGPHFFGQLSLCMQVEQGVEAVLDLKSFGKTSEYADALSKSVGAWRRKDAPTAQRVSEHFGALIQCPAPTPREGESLTIPVHADYFGVTLHDDVQWHVIALSFGWGNGGKIYVHVNQKVGRTRWFVASDTPLVLMWQLTHALHHVRPIDPQDAAGWDSAALDVASSLFEVDGECEVCVREDGAWWIVEDDTDTSLRFAPQGQDAHKVHVFAGELFAASFAESANAAVLFVLEDDDTPVWYRICWTHGPESLDVQRWEQGPEVDLEGITIALSPDGDEVAILESEREVACLRVFDFSGVCAHRQDEPWGADILWGWDASGVRFTTSDEHAPALSQRWTPGQAYQPTTAYRLVSPEGTHCVDYEQYGLTHIKGLWRMEYTIEEELLDLSPLIPEGVELARWLSPTRFFIERDVAPGHVIDVTTGQRQRLWVNERPFIGWYEFAMHTQWGVCFGESDWVWVRRSIELDS